MTTKEKELVPRFDGQNFQLWTRRLTNFLVQKDYEEVVGFDLDSFAPNPVQPVLTIVDDPTKSSVLVKQDRKGKAAIENFLSDSVLSVIGKCKTSYEVYLALHSNYQRTTMAAVVSALKTLVQTVKEPDESMQHYIGRIQINAEALKNSVFCIDMMPV